MQSATARRQRRQGATTTTAGSVMATRGDDERDNGGSSARSCLAAAVLAIIDSPLSDFCLVVAAVVNVVNAPTCSHDRYDDELLRGVKRRPRCTARRRSSRRVSAAADRHEHRRPSDRLDASTRCFSRRRLLLIVCSSVLTATRRSQNLDLCCSFLLVSFIFDVAGCD